MSDEQGVAENREPWELSEYEVDRLLATADDPRLRRMFGADYDELRDLAREALPATRRRDRGTVVFLPGILGSSLGKPRALFGNDTIWFDPVSIAMGDAPELKLTESSPVKSLGIVPLKHNFIRFRLTIAGFRVLSFHYDWRRSIPELGKRLAEFIAADRADEVMIVAHSMGGLVSRAALKAASPKVRKKIKRIVMLGTPNHGSFSPVQVLQGLNSTVQLIGKISRTDPVDLVKSTFSTFPSVYEMLPQPDVFDEFDLFDRQSWPTSPYRPTAARLKAAQEARAGLADPDERFRLIAGFGQPTVTHLRRAESGEFEYFKSDSGDGTVPLQMCELDEVPTRYAVSEHVDLLKHKEIAKAVIDLLRTGETERLHERPEVSRKLGEWIEPEAFRTVVESRRAWTADAIAP
ncbi:MAG: alpha/beta fold hydrolase, partial [Planctomycetales bacterium]|nr:alpha/beta fold hydrolase [Planctomycetales bacterium]